MEKVIREKEESQDATNVIQLVARIIAGDKQAEEEMDQMYRQGMIIMLTRRTGDPTLAHDLWQDTLVATLQAIRQNRLQDPGKLSSFVRGVSKNLTKNHFKIIKKRQEEPIEDDSFVCLGPSPLESLLQIEKIDMVRQAVNELKPFQYRKLLYLFYIAEEDKEKICADMNLSSRRFNTLLCRARKKLCKKLKKKL